jgi:hypothetical protein
MPLMLALKAESVPTTVSQALEAINEAEALAEGLKTKLCRTAPAQGVFLAAMGAEETQIEDHFAQPSESQRSRNRFR